MTRRKPPPRTRLLKPHYLFHPLNTARRVVLARSRTHAPRRVELPWGLALTVDPNEEIGRLIAASRIYDPVVSEAIYRLLDPGEVAVDAGAHVGYMTSLMAARVGASGRVIAFEPDPLVFQSLQANVASWAGAAAASVDARQLALSDSSGTAALSSYAAATNHGLGTLEPLDRASAVREVLVERLDALESGPLALLKIDVEGHELSLLRGAEDLLASGVIRDIVVEHECSYPDELSSLLERHGYTVSLLDMAFRGPAARDPRRHAPTLRSGPPSYLATRAPERALARIGRPGWRLPGVGPGLRRTLR